jgi:hypothetical protein
MMKHVEEASGDIYRYKVHHGSASVSNDVMVLATRVASHARQGAASEIMQ